MSANDTWMPLYIGDYLGDTMELDGAQHGAYLLLLMYYWRNGPLPADDVKLAQIARTDLRAWKKTIGPVVRPFFTESDGRLHQKRCDAELAKAQENWQRARTGREADADRLRRWRQQRQMPTREWDELRAEIFARDGSKCQRCGSGDDLHCDHILELSDGGTNDPDNLITLCRTCHSRKTAGVKTARHPPHKPNGEMPMKRISKAFPEHIPEHFETRSEMRPKPVLPLPVPSTITSTETKKESSVKSTTSFTPTLETPSRAREETPPPDALRTLLAEAKTTEPVLPSNAYRPLKPATNVGPGAVAAQVNRVAKACAMTIPYGVVRSRDQQITGLAVQPEVEGADGLKWQPADPVRSPDEQVAEALGISLTEATALLAANKAKLSAVA